MERMKPNGRRTRTRRWTSIRILLLIHLRKVFRKVIGDSHMLLGIRLTNLWMTNRAFGGTVRGDIFPYRISWNLLRLVDQWAKRGWRLCHSSIRSMLVGQFGHGRGEMKGTRLQSMEVAALNLSRREVALLFLSM